MPPRSSRYRAQSAGDHRAPAARDGRALTTGNDRALAVRGGRALTTGDSRALPARDVRALTAGDDADGRHRRPRSLADVGGSAASARSTRSRVAADDTPIVRWGDSSAYPADPRDWTAYVPVPRDRDWSARRPRPDHIGRHIAAHPHAARHPVIGSHRAPGTLPIESWLLIGKTKQQALLASLVAVGLLMVALPAEQNHSGVNVVNAAAQQAAGATNARKPTTTGKDTTKGGSGQDADQPAPDAASSAAASGTGPAVEPTDGTGRAPNGAGPGHSLRTTGTQAVALTFDDGPDPVRTPQILALLAKYQVKATFCLVGEQVTKHPEIVREIVAAGHTLCNHTWNHSLTIGNDKPAQIEADLARTSAAIRAAVPGAEIPFFRAPGGNFTDRLVSVAEQDGMTSLYWEVDPRDWEHPAGETATQHVTRVVTDIRRHVRPGAIVLSHDFNQPDTIQAYAKLLPWLTENFVIGLPGEPAPTATSPATIEPTPSDAQPTPDPAATTPSPDASAASAQ
jgi:peptidoglycan/xylan/chitin deacetylase (PgdA/CDA1 family)